MAASVEETVTPGPVLVTPALTFAPSGLATVRLKEQLKMKNQQSACVAQAHSGVGPNKAAAVTQWGMQQS